MKFTKKLGAVVVAASLACGLVVSAAPKSQANLKTKESVILQAGKSIERGVFMGTIRSIKLSKKGIVTVKKLSSTRLRVTGKKAGKVTVTIKTKSNPLYLYVTVKKPSFSCNSTLFTSQTSSGKFNSTVGITVTNKSGIMVSSMTVNYELTDVTGTVVEAKSFYASYVGNNQTFYRLVDYSYKDTAIASVKVNVTDCSIYTGKYTDQNKNITVNPTNQTDSSVSYTISNSAKKNVSGSVDVVFYDASGNIIYVRNISLYMKPNETKTENINFYLPQGTAIGNIQIYKRAYSTN